MAKEAVTQLFRAAQVNPVIRTQLNRAPTIEQFVELAKGYGYEFTIEEWQTMTRFSVEELESEFAMDVDLPY